VDIINVWFRAADVIVGSGGLVGYVWIAKYFIVHGTAGPGAGLLGGGVEALAALITGNHYRNSR
jgi:hypothetical protein